MHVLRSRGLLSSPMPLLRLLCLLYLLCWRLRLLRPASAKRRAHRLRQAATPTRRRYSEPKGRPSLYGCPSCAVIGRLADTRVALRCRRVAIATGCVGRRRHVVGSYASRAHPSRVAGDGREEGKCVRGRRRKRYGAPKVRHHSATAAAATTNIVWRHSLRTRRAATVLTTKYTRCTKSR